MATTYYVSNTASNGYGLGNDTTGNGTLSTPYLTVDKAQTIAANGDTININPTATVYVENSGSNYLNMIRQVTVQTDPTLVTAQGKARIGSPAAGARVINTNTAVLTFNNIIIDAQSNSRAGLTTNSAGTLNLTGVDFYNIAGTNNAISNNSNVTVVLDKVTCTAANGNASTVSFFSMTNASAAGTSLTMTGINVDGISAGFNFNTAANMTLIRTGISSDGTRCRFNNLNYAIRFIGGATITLADILSCDLANMKGGIAAIYDGQSTTAIITQLNVKYCDFSGFNSTTAGVLLYGQYAGVECSYNTSNIVRGTFQISTIGIQSPLIHHNVITQVSGTAEPIFIVAATGTPQVYNNSITTDVSSHAILMGQDGQQTPVSNLATSTSTINLGDTSANTYIDQPYTFIAGTAANNSQKITSFRFKMKKIGSPLGLITVKLYANSTGNPGTALETSEYTLAASALSSTSQWVEFWFPAHTSMSYSTVYHGVLSYSGTINGADYVQLASETTYATKAQTSADGVSWSANANATLFQVMTGAFEMVNPQIYNNIFTFTSNAAPHGALIGATYGGKIQRNQIYGGGIPTIFKLVDGTGVNTALCSDNVIFDNVGSQQAYRDKGSRGAMFIHNTIIETSTLEVACTLDNDFEATLTPQLNGQPSQNSVVKNNIIYCTSPSGSSPIYVVGSTNIAQPTCINPSIDYNNIFIGPNTTAMTDNRSGTSVTYTTFAQLQAAGFDVNGKNADPLLPNEVNPSKITDFIPPANSPARSMGANLNAIVPTDYFGTTFPSRPTVGAILPLSRTIGTRGFANNRTLIT